MFIFHALASSLASDLSTMVRLSLSAKRTAISVFTAGYKVGATQKRLEEEDVCITTRSLYRLIKKFKDTGGHDTLTCQLRQARDKKLSPDMLAIIDDTLKENDEATASELQGILVHRHPDLEVSISTIKSTSILGQALVGSFEYPCRVGLHSRVFSSTVFELEFKPTQDMPDRVCVLSECYPNTHV